ncbi:hypothetical protein B0O99DRAFT_641083 [Bisporella sp. PMI_857]|nr:hypothetical protein B0O99DRAFT_641083 [Bisporella sp. PMI_857]
MHFIKFTTFLSLSLLTVALPLYDASSSSSANAGSEIQKRLVTYLLSDGEVQKRLATYALSDGELEKRFTTYIRSDEELEKR